MATFIIGEIFTKSRAGCHRRSEPREQFSEYLQQPKLVNNIRNLAYNTMFNEFVKEARRLFSSKSNGGKQVPTWTNRLHLHKQVLIALSIVLLIGHSQFRDHFVCQGIQGADQKVTTNFCLINGTTTVLNSNESNTQSVSLVWGLLAFRSSQNSNNSI